MRLVTAGPTREYIDPIRYISNESSGKQGYEIALALSKIGIKTTLIVGPSEIIAKDLNVKKVKQLMRCLIRLKSFCLLI